MSAKAISREQVLPILIQACPSFQASWDVHRKDHSAELLYVALGDFARHLLQLDRHQQDQILPAVFDAIERLHRDGDSFVQEATTIGLLAGIQNVWAHANVDTQTFTRHLHPISRKWWKSLEDFWDGKSKFVGEGL